MSKPDPPPCSVRDCKQAAAAVTNGALLCGEHALEEELDHTQNLGSY
jgi:hypothetical protein